MGMDWCRLWWRGRGCRSLHPHISLGIEETELVPVLCRRADCIRNAEFTIVDDSDSKIVFCLLGDRLLRTLSPGRRVLLVCMVKPVCCKNAWYGQVEERGGESAPV